MVAFVVFYTVLAHTAPFEKQFTFVQPGGCEVKLCGRGDEFYAVFETPEGYTVLFDHARTAYVYATRSDDGSLLVASDWLVGVADPEALGLVQHLRDDSARIRESALNRQESRSRFTRSAKRWYDRKAALQSVSAATVSDIPIALAPPTFTVTGTKVGLTLLIDFDDATNTVPQAEIVSFCNGDAFSDYGNNGSVKKYFQDCSNGLLTYTNIVTAYVRIPNSLHPKSYYTDTSKECEGQANLLIQDALDILKALPQYASEIAPAFSNLTRDASGYVTAFNVFYAGGNGDVWGYGLWPHSGSLHTVGEQTLVADIKAYDYQVTDIGDSLTIGTFCHENGHMLCGYPDLYDYGYDSVGGAGFFCLMGYGGSGVNPVQICAYLKRASGWATTTELNSNSVLAATVSSAGVGVNHFYRYAKPGSSTEYYLVENRQKTGRDANIRASGVAVWHVDELGDRDNQSYAYNTIHANYELTLVQADNLWHLEKLGNYGDANDLFYSGNTAAAYSNLFCDGSAPSARWWDGSVSGLFFSEFSASGTNMTFSVQPASLTIFTPTALPHATVGLAYAYALAAYGGTSPYTWSVTSNTLPEGLTLAGNAITGTPAVAGTTLFRLQVTDSAAAATSAVFRLTVDQPRAIPFTETFEDAEAIPPGWSQEYVSQSVSWAFQTGGTEGVPTEAHGGAYNALFYAGRHSNDTTRLVSPMLDFGLSPTNAQLAFWHCMASTDGNQDQLRIYYRTNASAVWVQIAAYTNNTSDWTFRTVDLPNPGRTYFVAFEGLAAAGHGVCVDDVSVIAETAAPTIQTASPLSPGVVGVAYSTNFAANGGTMPYTWEVVSNALPPGLALSSGGALDGTPTAADDAYFRVSVTGGNGKASTNLFSLTVQGREAVPFAETFENGGAVPSGWSQEHVTNAADWAFQPGGYNYHPANAHSGTYNACLFYKSTTPRVTRLLSPPIDFGASVTNTQLTFWHCMQLWNPDQDELRLYYKSSPSGSWKPLAAFTTNTASWTQRTIPLPCPSRTYWIAFEGVAKYGYGVCVDDVVVTGTATPHATWLTNHFTDAEAIAGVITADTDDPDGDGIPNLLEYALGLDPRVADTNGVPTGGLVGDYLTLNYRQNKQATDVAYHPQACTNLAAAFWSADGITEIARADSNAWWSVTVRHDTPVTNAPQRFMRLRVDRP